MANPIELPDDLVAMATVGAPFGVNGWIRVYPDTETPDRLFAFARWWIGTENAWNAYDLIDAKLHGKCLLAKLEPIAHRQRLLDRDQAAQMRGLTVAVPRSALAPTGPDEFYWTDLIGLSVENTAGVHFGVIDRLLEAGAHDILVVIGECERLIPFVRHIVLDVQLAHRRVVVDWDAAVDHA